HAARRLSAGGVANTFVEGGAVARLEPGLAAGVAAALLIPLHGYVAVPTLMSALAASARRFGVSLSVRRIDGIESTSSGIRLTTSDGALHADAIVIAAGSWSGQLHTPLPPKELVRPIRGQLVQLRFPGPPLSRVTWGSRCYLVP